MSLFALKISEITMIVLALVRYKNLTPKPSPQARRAIIYLM
jgi:hypothetical protein